MSHKTTHDPYLRPQRIAFVVHAFVIGGLQRCVARLANHLDRDRFQPLIVCLERNDRAADWLNVEDVPVLELHKRAGGNDWKLLRRLAKVLREQEIDIVHSHNWGTLVETAIARRIAGTQVHVHAERGMELDAIHASPLRSRLRAIATRWSLNRAECVVAVAEAVRGQVMARCHKLRHAIQIVPNGVDPVVPKGGSEIRERLGLPHDSITLGSIGRLAEVKDFGVAIRATQKLRHHGKQVHLLLAGDGPERSALETLTHSIGAEKFVHFLGWQRDVAACLDAIDVYFNVSLNEGMSQSVLEAMAAGKPMVVTDVGDNALLTSGSEPCGLVVPPGDMNAVADAALQLMDNSQLRRQLALNATSRHDELYSVEKMVQTYESIYMDLTNKTQVNGHSSRKY